MALALILLAGTGLMIRSLVKLWNVNPGFDSHNLLTFFISSPTNDSNPDANRASWRLISDKLSTIPGVTSASLSAGAMPMGGDSEVPFWIEGQPKPASEYEMKQTLFYLVQPDYLRVMRIPLKRGRFLSSQDNEHSPLVTAIDDRFAKLAFGNDDPIGKRVNFDILGMSAEIVGVVGHVNQWGLDSDSNATIQAQCYFDVSQIPDRFVPISSSHLGVVLRTESSPLAQAASIRHTLEQTNSQMVMFQTRTMEEVISNSLAAGFALTRLMGTMLFGISAHDPVTFVAVAVALIVVAILASYIPAWRAAKVDPMVALRYE
jgi:hypothetical protein